MSICIWALELLDPSGCIDAISSSVPIRTPLDVLGKNFYSE